MKLFQCNHFQEGTDRDITLYQPKEPKSTVVL